MKPTKNRILLAPLSTPKEIIQGGIILSVTPQKEQCEWMGVVSVGPGVRDIRPDDTALIDRFSQDTERVVLNHVMYFIVREPNVLAIKS